MRIGTKMAPVPGVKGTATSTREPSGYLLRLRKLMPPFDRSSQTTTSSAKPRRRTHARTRAFTRVRLRRGTTRSSTDIRAPLLSSVETSESDSIQMEGESQWGQCRATHLRTSKDFNCSSLRYTTSRRWQKLHSMSRRARASSAVCKKAVCVLIDLGDHARPRVFPLLAFHVPPQMEFLSWLQLFGEAQHAAIAADEERFRSLRKRGSRRGSPGRLDGHAEADAVALAEPTG